MKIWPEKKIFLSWRLIQVQEFGTVTRYGLEILHQRGKRVKTKSQKVFGANSYVCWSYSEKTDREGPFLLSHPE